MRTILIVDDDSHIREILRFSLEKEGLNVIEAENGGEGLQYARQHKPDVIILDIMMPEMNGLELCRELRKADQTPVLFLSSRDDEIDRILGLELGGDDYMTKPFSPRELLARVKVMLRRLEQAEATKNGETRSDNDVLAHSGVSMHRARCQVYWQNAPLTLTTTEYHLLEVFLKSPERVYTRDALIQADVFKDIISDRTIDSHIRRLRNKFLKAGCTELIETVHGFGYRLGACRSC